MQYKIKAFHTATDTEDTVCICSGNRPYPSLEVDRKPRLFVSEELAQEYADSLSNLFTDMTYEVVTETTEITLRTNRELIKERDLKISLATLTTGFVLIAQLLLPGLAWAGGDRDSFPVTCPGSNCPSNAQPKEGPVDRFRGSGR